MRRATLVLLVVGLVLAASCNNGDDDDVAVDQGSPAERVAAAPDRTRADGSARTAFESVVTGLGDGDEPAEAVGEGLADFARNRGSLDIDLGLLLAGAGIPGLDAETETVYEGSVIYLRSDLLSGFLSLDTPWLRVDLEAPSPVTDLDLSPLAALSGNDPGGQLGLLVGVDPESVKEIGAEEVRGEKTLRYLATVALASAAEQAGTQAERQRFERLMTQLDTEELELQVDLDRQGRVRRLAYEQPLPADEGDVTSEVVLEYFDFGAEVDIALPEAGEFTDLADVPVPGG